MTDGVYNTFGGTCDRNCTNLSAQARNRRTSARNLCSNMKEAKTSWSTRSASSSTIRNAETSCGIAPRSASNFHRAENGDHLRQAFRSIAEDLMRLRLSQ